MILLNILSGVVIAKTQYL